MEGITKLWYHVTQTHEDFSSNPCKQLISTTEQTSNLLGLKQLSAASMRGVGVFYSLKFVLLVKVWISNVLLEKFFGILLHEQHGVQSWSSVFLCPHMNSVVREHDDDKFWINCCALYWCICHLTHFTPQRLHSCRMWTEECCFGVQPVGVSAE